MTLANPHHPKRQKPRKLDKPFNIPKVNQPVFDAWMAGGIQHRTGNMRRQASEAISKVKNAKYFHDKPGYEDEDRPFTDAQMIKAIKRFLIMRNDPTYYPANKQPLKELTLATFFYNPWWKNGNGRQGHSMFLQCLREEPKQLSSQDPGLVKHCSKMWKQHVGGNLDPDDAERVVGRVMRFHNAKGNQDWLKRKRMVYPELTIECWIKAAAHFSGEDIPVGHLLSDFAERNMKEYMQGRKAR